MFIIKRDQIEAFRIPMREAARDKLIANLISEGQDTQVSPDKKTLIQTDDDGNKTVLSYSADALPVAITKPSGVRYGMGYDPEGRLSRVDYPDGNQLQFKFANGQLQQVAASPEKTYRFDYQKGLLTRVVYPGQKTQQFVYNEFGNILALIDRTGQVNEYVRTPEGQLQAIRDPLNRAVRFRYDENGLLTNLVFPDNSQQSYQYDDEEDVLYVQLRDGKNFSQHYENNLIRQLNWEHGPTVRFDYNEQDQPTSIGLGAHLVTFAYDNQKRLAAENSPFGNMTFLYDTKSRPNQLTLPTGLTVGYDYDTDNRVTALHTAGKTTRFVYSADDLLAEIHYPNGLTEYQQRSHTQGLRSVQVQGPQGRLVSEQQYAYDNWDRLTRYQDSTVKQNFQLTYDDECRLTGVFDAQTRQPRERFTYDAKGNLTVFNGYPVVVGDMDEVRQIGRAGVRYDALGNVTRLNSAKGKLDLIFARNSTLTTALVGADTWQYDYDGIGRRISKTNGTQLWRFAWAGSQMVVEEYFSRPGATPLVRSYIYLPDSQVPVGFHEGGQLYWLQADVRGAVTHVFDQQGQVVWHGSYSAFGEVTVHTAQIRQPWRLMGQYEDDETGLYYNLARYYCPWLTTYLSLDPLWIDYNQSTYSYCQNNPYNLTDPVGLAGNESTGWSLGSIARHTVGFVANMGISIAGEVAGAALGGSGGAAAGFAIGMVLGGPVGALIGATIGEIAGSYVGAVVGSGVGSFFGTVAEQLINGEPVCWDCAWQEAKSSMAMTALNPLFGMVAGKVARTAAKSAMGKRAIAAVGERIAKIKNGVKRLVPAFKKVRVPFLKGWNLERVLSIPKKQRPNPETYLPKEYIEKHLAKFEKEGGGYLVPKEVLDRRGRKTLGRPDGQFMMTKEELDNLLKRANGDMSVIEKELGIPEGAWKGKELARIDVPNPKDVNLRMPTGNEDGANELWLPGGKLPTGYSEAVVDSIPEGKYIESIIKF